MHGSWRSLSLGIAAVVFSLPANAIPPSGYEDVDHFSVPTNAAMLVYSPATNTLALKNAASAIVAIDIASRVATPPHFANWKFTDLAISPSGRYIFGADYGDEDSYGDPINASYVHRLDLANKTWELRTAYLAANIESVSDTQVILKSCCQWVTFTNNSWGSGTALVVLNATSGWPWGPGYYAGVYSGDFQYDFRTGRLLHANSGLSSQEIQAFRIVNNEFTLQEGSGGYGIAYGYGGTAVLATDGSAFYYGQLQVDGLDVSHKRRVFPELIRAANGNIAFGDGKYYDARTGALLGTLPFSTTVYALNPSGDDFWAFDPATTTVHHFATGPLPPLPPLPPPASAYADLVFTALAPCRIYDSRPSQNGPGGWSAGSANSINIGPNLSYAFQGGSPSDCGLLGGMVTGQIAAVMASVSTAGQAADGFLTFYPSGSANPFPTSVTQAYRSGPVQSSFVIMPTDVSAPVHVSGFTTAATQVIVDIVGYFAQPKAAALDCYQNPLLTVPIAPNGDAQPTGAACLAGYYNVDTACHADSFQVTLSSIDGSCRYHNNDSVTRNVAARSTCCRAAGR